MGIPERGRSRDFAEEEDRKPRARVLRAGFRVLQRWEGMEREDAEEDAAAVAIGF